MTLMHVRQLQLAYAFLWKNGNSSLDFLNVSQEFLSISFHVLASLHLASVQQAN